jgi:phospholipid/cholesterol/gamma-HCH transport system ATP-binding protein
MSGATVSAVPAPAAVPTEALPPPPGIRVEGLRKRFQRQPVLRGVDLDVRPGELMVVIGRSGGGKSVLLRHLLGLVRPDSGRVLIDGQDVTRLRGRALDRVRERFGVVFQGGALFDSLSVFENVRFPLREKSHLPADQIDARTLAALEQVGLGDMGAKFPAEVSGGMRKRVAIARALVTEPRVVFLDEPTTGLDPILVNTIHHLVVELQRKFQFTAVMVSHEIPEIFQIAHRVAVLHDGRIRAVGPPAEIEGSDDPAVRRFIQGEVEIDAT